jgi:hypothetical protein
MDDAAITGLYTVGVPVADQDRALEFHVETLALERRLDQTPSTPIRSVAASTSARCSAGPGHPRCARSVTRTATASRSSSSPEGAGVRL